jgi:hypothetical protein
MTLPSHLLPKPNDWLKDSPPEMLREADEKAKKQIDKLKDVPDEEALK